MILKDMFKKFIVKLFGIKGKHLPIGEMNVTEFKIENTILKPIKISSQYKIDKEIYDRAPKTEIMGSIMHKIQDDIMGRIFKEDFVTIKEWDDLLGNKKCFLVEVNIVKTKE